MVIILEQIKNILLKIEIMEQNLSRETRTESDLIGSREVPADALYGVH